jgi:hypothetical protein
MTLGTAEPYSQPPVTEPPAKNTFQRIAGVLFAPADTFRDIARKPDIIVPLVILLVLALASAIIFVPRMDVDAMMRAQMEQSGRQMSDADMEKAAKFSGSLMRVMGYLSPVWAVLIWLIIAGVLLLAFRLFGGEGNFKQAFSATLYAWIPNTIGGIITTIVVAARGTVDPTTMATLVKSSPAFLVEQKDNPVVFALLSSLDIFTIWTLILLILGFAALSKLSRGKSAAIVISLWLVTVFVKLAGAAFTASRMKKT